MLYTSKMSIYKLASVRDIPSDDGTYGSEETFLEYIRGAKYASVYADFIRYAKKRFPELEKAPTWFFINPADPKEMVCASTHWGAYEHTAERIRSAAGDVLTLVRLDVRDV